MYPEKIVFKSEGGFRHTVPKRVYHQQTGTAGNVNASWLSTKKMIPDETGLNTKEGGTPEMVTMWANKEDIFLLFPSL